MLRVWGQIRRDEVSEPAVSRSTASLSTTLTGILPRIIHGVSREIHYEAKAHAAEITDIAIHQGDDGQFVVATASRDRVIQLFQKSDETWRLSQTLTDHSGSISGVRFSGDGKRLLSCAGDRTIVIREVALKGDDGPADIAFLPVRTISLKSAPVSLAIAPELPDILTVSTMDRCISEYDITSGRSQSSFRATDQENNDPIVMDALLTVRRKTKTKNTSPCPTFLLAGVSTTDKSIRLYDRTGALLSREWGHTEGITSLACLSPSDHRTSFISTGTDGTVMIWDLSWDPPTSRSADESGTTNEALGGSSPPREPPTAARTPLRRVLSRAELAEFRRPISELAETTASPVPSPTTTRPNSPPPPPLPPARSLRKKTSRYSLATVTPTATPATAIPCLPPAAASKRNSPHTSPKLAHLSEGSPSASSSPRDRSPSPPPVQPRRPGTFRRPSLDVVSQHRSRRGREPQTRTKSCGPVARTGTGARGASAEAPRWARSARSSGARRRSARSMP